MAAAPTDVGRAASVEGASCLEAGPATAIITSSARDGAGSTLSASVGLASGASFPVGGVSATLWRWGLGKEDDGLQNRVVINIQRNNSTLYSLTDTYPARSAVLALRFRISRRRWGTRGASQIPPRMFRRSCLLAPPPQLPGCPRSTRCQQYFPSVL
jgi:hypothetical protein